MNAPSSKFYSRIGLVFVLTLENAFFQKFHFKAKRKSIGSSKDGTRDFQNSPLFERSTFLYVTIRESFKRFQCFNFETDFLKNGNLFLKTGVPFLVESIKIENASLPYKSAISEANVKKDRMVTTKWTYHKERSFASNYFIFLKILFQFKNLL